MKIIDRYVTISRIANDLWTSVYRREGDGEREGGYTAQSAGPTALEAAMNLADLMGTFKGLREDPPYAPPEESSLIPGIMHSLWLHCGWREMTRNLTTAEKELFADLIEGYMDGEVKVDRWWL